VKGRGLNTANRPRAGPNDIRERRAPTPRTTKLFLVLPAFLAVGLAIYSPCFRGPFVSDDVFAVLNPYATPLSAGALADLFSPRGATATMQSEYRPLWFLLHAVERQSFGDSPAAYVRYHVANVVLHSLVSALLVVLFARSGLPTLWAILGGAFFLVHPANVEAVAWISQLTSIAGLAFAVGALLLAPRYAPAALLCFALGLLTKPFAAFALPIAVLLAWEQKAGGRESTRWVWLGGWTLALAAFTGIEMIAARGSQYGAPPIHADAVVVVRTIAANFFRYLVMAVSGYGLAAFHQARPALSWLNPWWLAGAAALVLIAWRTAMTLSRRRPEGVYWTWALLSFVPISQIVPFTHPLADRYLYFILPGLIGGALLAIHALVQRLPQRSRRRAALQLGAAVALLLLIAFAGQTRQRAGLWTSFESLARDSMQHYPDGLWAHLLRSREAAAQGDGDRSAAELRAAFELGHRDYSNVLGDPVWARVLRQPSFQQLLADMADWWIQRVNTIEDPNQLQLYQLASAYWLRGNFVAAQRSLERALVIGGPMTDRVQADLSRLHQGGKS
jgi:hypothetical protein